MLKPSPAKAFGTPGLTVGLGSDPVQQFAIQPEAERVSTRCEHTRGLIRLRAFAPLIIVNSRPRDSSHTKGVNTFGHPGKQLEALTCSPDVRSFFCERKIPALEAKMLDIAARILLFPILATQAVIVRRSALRLPDPSGRREGVSGQGAVLRLMIVGDSSATGVGTSHQEEALLGHMRKRLSQTNTVHWTVDAKTGATTADTIARLQASPQKKFDVVSVSLGVNDITSFVPRSVWLRQFSTLLQIIEAKFDPDVICVSGIPRMRYFPLLPQPLRWVVSAQGLRFDRALRRLVAGRSRYRFVEMDFEPDVTLMSPDGFHPGPKMYAEWGRKVYRAIRHDVRRLGKPHLR